MSWKRFLVLIAASFALSTFSAPVSARLCESLFTSSLPMEEARFAKFSVVELAERQTRRGGQSPNLVLARVEKNPTSHHGSRAELLDKLAATEKLVSHQLSIIARKKFSELEYEKYVVLSREIPKLRSALLASSGVGHTIVRYKSGDEEIAIIHPTGSSELNRASARLRADSGTWLTVTDTVRSHYDRYENTLKLSIYDALSPAFEMHVREAIIEVRKHRIHEFSVSTASRAEEVAFVVDPENAIPDSLRFLSLTTRPGAMALFVSRIAVRIGRTATLPKDIRDSLDSMSRIQRNSDEKVLSFAIRQVDGSWRQSVPVVSNEVDWARKKGESFDELRADLPKSQIGDTANRPDLFFIMSGVDHISPLALKWLQDMAASNNSFNSMSIVTLSKSRNNGLLYFISTIDSVRGFNTTADADQLAGSYNRVHAIRSKE